MTSRITVVPLPANTANPIQIIGSNNERITLIIIKPAGEEECDVSVGLPVDLASGGWDLAETAVSGYLEVRFRDNPILTTSSWSGRSRTGLAGKVVIWEELWQ